LANKGDDQGRDGEGGDGPRYGYVTLDSASRIIPMTAGDENKHKYPLVGVWVWSLEVLYW